MGLRPRAWRREGVEEGEWKEEEGVIGWGCAQRGRERECGEAMRETGMVCWRKEKAVGGGGREGDVPVAPSTHWMDVCRERERERERGCWLRWMVPPVMVSATHIDVRRWGWLCGCRG